MASFNCILSYKSQRKFFHTHGTFRTFFRVNKSLFFIMKMNPSKNLNAKVTNVYLTFDKYKFPQKQRLVLFPPYPRDNNFDKYIPNFKNSTFHHGKNGGAQIQPPLVVQPTTPHHTCPSKNYKLDFQSHTHIH